MLSQPTIAFQAVDRTDGPTSFLDGVLGDKYKATIRFYWQKGTQGAKTLQIDKVAGTITNITPDDTESFITDGFTLEEFIAIPASSLNTAPIQITGVSATVLTVTGLSANEAIGNSFIWVSSPITQLDFLYNLLGNGATPNFSSLTDVGTVQKYFITGTSDDSSTKYFTIGTASKAWVTDTLTGNTSQCTLQGTGTSLDYKQGFIITHYFFVTPLSLATQLRNFQNNIVPSYYPLTYSYGINVYYTSGSPIIIDSMTATVDNGSCAWANQNSSGTQPEFSLASIDYQDANSGAMVAQPIYNSTTWVTMVLKSASGLFAAGSKVILSHIYSSIIASDYQNTQTTLRQNFMHERAIQLVGSAAVNGEFYDTAFSDYNLFQDVVCTLTDVHTVTVTCTVEYSDFLQGILGAKASNNRNCILLATCEV